MGAKQNIGRTTNSSIPAPFMELHQTLTSRAAAISPVLDQLMRFIRLIMGKFGAAKKQEEGIEIALGEALANAVPDPTEPERRLLSHGRGLHLMRALMDEVSFEKNGTVVRMRKRMKTSIG